jgi:hypothetical protein
MRDLIFASCTSQAVTTFNALRSHLLLFTNVHAVQNSSTVTKHAINFFKKRTSALILLLLNHRAYTKCYICSIALCGAETSTLRKVDQKYLGSFEMSYWRRMEKISWPDRVRNEELLQREKEARNILHTIKRRKADWIGHILRRNCLLNT